MPLDAITIRALSRELSQKLLGGRIDKVQQPERSMILISLRSQGENLRLLFSAGSGSARIHLTRASFENPTEPPMFCMLLRKHLIGARITGVEQPQNERMLIFTLDCYDELGVRNQKKLVAELIGRNSNLILVGEDGRIVDCLRRLDYAGDPLRRLLPGMIYRLPPQQDKLAFLSSDEGTLCALLKNYNGEDPLEKWLMDHFSGLSPLLCRELVHRCGNDGSRLPAAFFALQESVLADDMQAFMLSSPTGWKDFSFLPIRQYGTELRSEPYESFSQLLDAFYSQKDRESQQKRRAQELTRGVKTARDRLQRKLLAQYEELRKTESREETRIQAELLIANIYRIKKGDRQVTCENYYEPDCPPVVIKLNPLKTPQENAAMLYREYNKQKGAHYHLGILIREGEEKLEYLNSVLDALARSSSEKDLNEIRRELSETGVVKRLKGKSVSKTKEQQPLRYRSDDGFEILVGRSNTQNDQLTTKLARRTDLWLHAQKIHGSHVIIRCDGLTPPDSTIMQAACLAAYHSQGRDSGKIPVDYTMVRNVKKPSGALPGKVIYTDYASIVVSGDEELVKRLTWR